MDSPKSRTTHLYEDESTPVFSSSGRVRELMLLRRQNLRPVSAANVFATRMSNKTKAIPYRKEELYDRVLQMKGEVNNVKTENVKLKTKMKQIEGKLGRRVADDPPVLMDSLKQQVIEMRAQLAAKDDEITFIKKRLKYTKMTELETELKVTVDECTRLRRVLYEAMEELGKGVVPIDLQERYLKLKGDYRLLKREFFEMTAYVQENKSRSGSTKPESRKSKKAAESRSENALLLHELRKLKDTKCPKCGTDLNCSTSDLSTDCKPVKRGKSVTELMQHIWVLLWTQDVKVPDFWQRLDPEMLGAVKPHALVETLKEMGVKLSHVEVEKVLETLGANQGQSVHRMALEDVLERYRPPLSPDQSKLLSHLSLRLQTIRMDSADLPTLMNLPQPHCSFEQFSDSLETSELKFAKELSREIAKIVFVGYASMPTDRVYARLSDYIGTIALLTQEKESELDTDLRRIFSGKSATLTSKFQRLDMRGDGVIRFTDFLDVTKDVGINLSPSLQRYLRVLFYAHRQELDQVPYETFIQVYCLANNPLD